jgi:hypothetical protein
MPIRFHTARIDGPDTLEAGVGLRETAENSQRPAEAYPGVWRRRIEFSGATKTGLRSSKIVLCGERLASRLMRCGVVRLQRERAIKADQRLIQPAELSPHSAQVAVSFRSPWFEHRRPQICGLGLGELVPLRQRRGQVEVTGRHSGIELDRGAGAPDCSLALSQLVQRPREIAVRHCLARGEGDRAAIAFDRFPPLSAVQQDIPEIEMGVGEIRSQPQRLPDHFGRALQVAAIERDHAEQMNGRGIIRRQPGGLPVVRFCLIYLAGTVQCHALLQDVRRLRPPGPKLGVWLAHDFVLDNMCYRAKTAGIQTELRWLVKTDALLSRV